MDNAMRQENGNLVDAAAAAWRDLHDWIRLAEAQRASHSNPYRAPNMPTRDAIRESIQIAEWLGRAIRKVEDRLNARSVDACAPYLKPGETPAEALQRLTIANRELLSAGRAEPSATEAKHYRQLSGLSENICILPQTQPTKLAHTLVRAVLAANTAHQAAMTVQAALDDMENVPKGAERLAYRIVTALFTSGAGEVADRIALKRHPAGTPRRDPMGNVIEDDLGGWNREAAEREVLRVLLGATTKSGQEP